MNWGGFAGGFSTGFQNGVKIGQTVGDAIKQKKIQDVREQGIAEAQAAQSKAIADLVKDNGVAPPMTPQQSQTVPVAPVEKIETRPLEPVGTGATPGQPAGVTPTAPDAAVTPASPSAVTPSAAAPSTPPTPAIPVPEAEKSLVTPTAPIVVPADAAAGGLPGKKRFSVGDASFDTREEAEAHAKKNAPTVMDFMAKTLVPKMTEAYVAQGDMDKAAAWEKWAEDRQSKTAMKEWAQAWRAASAGNIEKAADHVFNLYKTFDDGITPMGKEIVKDKQGSITGFNVRLKNDATGEERSQFIDKSALTEMGLSALSPPQMFEQAYKRKAEADQMAAKARIEAATEARKEGAEVRKEGRAETREIAKDERQQNNAIELKTIEGQIKAANYGAEETAKVQAKVAMLKKSGIPEDRINDMMPAIIGIGEFKKDTSPTEARRMIYTELSKDRLFNSKTQEQKDKIIDDSMRVIYGRIPPKEGSQLPAAGGIPPAPATSKRESVGTIGTPAAPAAGGTPKGVPIFDVKTGQIIYR